MLKTILTLATLLLISIGCNAAESNEAATKSAPTPTTQAVAATQASASAFDREAPLVKRPLSFTRGGEWIGNAICYGPHRDGQAPGGDSPTREQLLEDLHILSKHWHVIRMYGSVGPTEDVLELIQEHKIDLKVVVGAWISTEATLDEDGEIIEILPEAIRSNQSQVDKAVDLANAYPGTVAAITVGNETQVFWSAHKVRPEVLVNYIRQARAHTRVPVSTADVSTFWQKPESKAVADEVDFIVNHIYAMWNKQSLDDAMPWTINEYNQSVLMHPDHFFVIGETGWATTKHDQGEQATIITAQANEDAQARFYKAFIDWTTANHIPNFYFEAFDENWKGGDHPNEVEKHWGLFNADRTPKKAVSEVD